MRGIDFGSGSSSLSVIGGDLPFGLIEDDDGQSVVPFGRTISGTGSVSIDTPGLTGGGFGDNDGGFNFLEDIGTGGTGDGGDDVRNDTYEPGIGQGFVDAGAGDDVIYSFSWGGEPEIAQDSDAEKVEPNEPRMDNDSFVLGEGADTMVFRWLIDARPEILDKHRDPETGDVDYRKVAGENDNAHDHWVETMGDDIVYDYNPDEDELVFEGHTLALDRIEMLDADNDGQDDDSVAYFYSEQGGAGAHQGDELGSVTFMDYEITEGELGIQAGVFYGVEDPYTAAG